jgi:hypothetical protein
MMKTPKTSRSRRRRRSRRRSIVIALLAAATTIVTVGMAIPIVVKPAYAQLDDISEQIVGGEEIPDSDDIREKIGEKITSQLPRLPEQASLLPIVRPPPALAI